MLTPQEVEQRVFPKAKKNGYDMQDVDSFLDQLTADYSELYKENAVLKRKMKVLADKITEYQETEGAMRATLLAAQKMADQIVEEAKTKRQQLLEETETIVRERTGALAEQVAAEEARLQNAKTSVAAYLAGVQELLKQEQAYLDSLPAEPAQAPAAVPTEDQAAAVAEEIGDRLRQLMVEESAPQQEVPPQQEQAPQQEAPTQPTEQEQETGPIRLEEVDMAQAKSDEPIRIQEETTADEAPTRRMDLSQLRFGRNYEIK